MNIVNHIMSYLYQYLRGNPPLINILLTIAFVFIALFVRYYVSKAIGINCCDNIATFIHRKDTPQRQELNPKRYRKRFATVQVLR